MVSLFKWLVKGKTLADDPKYKAWVKAFELGGEDIAKQGVSKDENKIFKQFYDQKTKKE